MARTFLLLAITLGFLGVMLGSFGAHYLKPKFRPGTQQAFETGVRYQLIHATVLLALALVMLQWIHPLITVAGWILTLGIILFSGSLYGLALVGGPLMAIMTPIGGTFLLAGWLLFGLGVFLAK
jgi:uncharacterized membrane protein YgdD (TMEM256/DUF423 family)